jgi:transcriptional regulator with XRE-family HTH domain
VNNRIKAVREALGMSQREFGEKTGVSRDVISNLEYGRVEPKELFINHVCTIYNVNENWLRTGEGSMFVELPEEDEYFKAAAQISKANDKFAMQALIEYWKLDDNGKRLLKDFIIHIAEKSKE